MARDAQTNAGLIVERGIQAAGEDKIAFAGEHTSLSYGELRLQANRMGHLLRELGVRREDRVLLVLENSPVFPIAFLGALRIGAIPIPVSVRETAAHFRHFVEDSYAELVVCDADMLPALHDALAEHHVRFLARGAHAGAVELDGALAAQEAELSPLAVHPDDMAFWLYTSGTTGKPKGVVHMHHTIEVVCETFARHILEEREHDRLFSTTKLYHAYGLGNSLFYPLHFGATSILLDGTPTPERILATLRAQQPTIYCSVPALYRQLLAERAAEDAFGSVRLCTSASEPLPLRTFEQWRERFGLEILDGIGATEMVVTFCCNAPGDVLPGTTGRAIPGYELRLADEQGVVLEGPAVGTLEVRGPSRAASYWHQQERTARSMRGEWFATGDRFSRREDGAYVYVARADDMLKVGGLWVSPIDIEQVLLEHPAVDRVAVVGATIDDYTRLAAFVVCGPDARADTQLEDDLRSWCKQRLRDYEYPHVIRFVDDLPQTLSGKAQRFKLRQLLEREAASLDASPSQPTGAIAQALAEVPERERLPVALELVLTQVAAVLSDGSVAATDARRAFEELGFDSLTGVELRNRLVSTAGIDLPSTLIFDHSTPEAVARLLCAGVADAPNTDESSYLARALEAVTHRPTPMRMPPAPLDVRVKTSPWLRSLVPARMAVARAERRAQETWEQSAEARADALAAMETVVAGTPREHELDALARAHLIESGIDRALFWQRPWSASIDAVSRERVRAALSTGRGVLLSACHVGAFYRLQCAPPFAERITYIVPGAWFFEPPTPNYWGRRLARWHKGMNSHPVPARASFRVIQALLERGEAVFLFFDMPGPRETRFLGKPATLAEGTAQLAVRADAIVLAVRARRAAHRVWVDVAAPFDPRELGGVTELHGALAAHHERWILENPAAMEDPRSIGWEEGASAEAWVAPERDQKSLVAGRPT